MAVVFYEDFAKLAGVIVGEMYPRTHLIHVRLFYTLFTLNIIVNDINGRVVKVTSHLHLVPRSRIRGAISPLFRFALMAWCSVKAQGQVC